jgi:hypothetical protein
LFLKGVLFRFSFLVAEHDIDHFFFLRLLHQLPELLRRLLLLSVLVFQAREILVPLVVVRLVENVVVGNGGSARIRTVAIGG